MANLLWTESSPADTDSVGQGDDEIRSLKTSIRNGMAEEHLWPSATGGNFGVHLLGSARPYYGAQSLVSSSGTDGRLMVTSDTSNLFHVGSAGTMFLGGQNVLSAGSSPTGGQRFYWATEFGVANTSAGLVNFPNSGYSGVPFVLVSVFSASPPAANLPLGVVVNGVTAALFTFTVSTRAGTQINASSTSIMWQSLGTRTF